MHRVVLGEIIRSWLNVTGDVPQMFWFQLDIITIFRQLRYKRRIGRNITDFTYKRPRTISFHIATDSEGFRNPGLVFRAMRFINLIPKAQSDKPLLLKYPAGFPTRPPNEQLWIISDPLYLTPSLGNAAKKHRHFPPPDAVSRALRPCHCKAFLQNCFSPTYLISASLHYVLYLCLNQIQRAALPIVKRK